VPVFNTTILSDGEECSVQRLELFELTRVGPMPPPDFEYEIESGDGKSYKIIYPLQERLKNPPKEPTAESGKWDHIEWDRFQAALTVRQKQLEIRHERLINCAIYIIEHCLIEKDRSRVVTKEDYQKIYRLAICPEITMEDIQQELNNFYHANWGGDDLLQLLGGIKGSPGEYWTSRIWEYQLMNSLGWTISEYSKMDVIERTRRIISANIDDWLGIINDSEARRKAEERGAANNIPGS